MANTHWQWWRMFGIEELDPYGGPFNGQSVRRALFEALLRIAQPVALVETGCFTGSTTVLLAQTDLPVYSVEMNEQLWRVTKVRVRHLPNVHLARGDSRAMLRQWLEGPLRPSRDQPLFFYLDAHGTGELPLAEELAMIFSGCPKAVVMVDDFEVPGDEEYGFDDYGPGQRLNAEYLERTRVEYGLTLLYPSTSGGDETGCRRGCVVLAGPAMAPRLLPMEELR